MPINFNLLRQTGPANFYEGLMQGQEEVRANAMAQQKAMQDQEMNALRMQQVRGAIGQQEREVKSQAAAQKTGMFRERLLRARTPDDARNIVRMQYADPDLSPVLSQVGTLEQALAEVPNDPTELRRYIEQEAVGMGDWLKLQMKARMPMNVGNAVYIPDTDSFRTPPREPAPVAQPAMVSEFNFARSPEGGGFQGSYQDFVIAREAAKRPPPAPRADRAPRTQQTTLSDGSIALVNMDTGAVTPVTMGGVQVKGKGSKELAVSEQQASYNLGRILDAAKEINTAIKKDPSALKPGVGEAAAASVGLSGTANVARNAQRQIVFGAQRDALDAMLYLATGAAYNKEQLEGQMAAYVPAFTDKPDAVEAKRTRMLGLIQNAKVRAGKAWTPELDAASQVLFQPIVSGNKPAAASGATGGWSVVK